MTSGKTTPGWQLWRRIRNETCVLIMNPKCADGRNGLGPPHINKEHGKGMWTLPTFNRHVRIGKLSFASISDGGDACLGSTHSPCSRPATQESEMVAGSNHAQVEGELRGVPEKGVWTSVNMRVWTCKLLRVKRDQTSRDLRPPVLGTPLVPSRTTISVASASW